MKKGKFIIISGPSGVGKGTICNVLLKEMNAWYSVSMTTRGIREGEVDGINYYFISKDEFRKRIDEGKLLEYNIYNDNYYGTPKDKVLEKMNEGKDVFLEIDVNGARNIKNMFYTHNGRSILASSFGIQYIFSSVFRIFLKFLYLFKPNRFINGLYHRNAFSIRIFTRVTIIETIDIGQQNYQIRINQGTY